MSSILKLTFKLLKLKIRLPTQQSITLIRKKKSSFPDSYNVWHAKGLRAVKMMKKGCYNLLEPTGVLFLHQHIPLISQHWQCLPHIKDDTPEQVTVINANKTYHPIASSAHSHYNHMGRHRRTLALFVFTLSNSSTRWTNIRITRWCCAAIVSMLLRIRWELTRIRIATCGCFNELHFF